MVNSICKFFDIYAYTVKLIAISLYVAILVSAKSMITADFR